MNLQVKSYFCRFEKLTSMKKHFILLALIVSCFTLLQAQPTNKPKKPKKPKTETKPKDTPKETPKENAYIFADFRDIKWGEHIDSIYKGEVKVTFVKSTEYGDKNAYIILDDDMNIGTVLLSNIFYIFNEDDRFVGVIMMGQSKQFGEMRYILINKFGAPHKEDETVSSKKYFWTIDDVRISLSNENISKKFTVDFTSDYDINKSKTINREVDDF